MGSGGSGSIACGGASPGGTGGASAAGGVSGMGGSGTGALTSTDGAAPSETTTTVTACAGATTIDVSAFPVCPMCAGGRCVANSLVTEDQRARLAACDENTTCVPEPYAELVGDFLPKACRSINDAEGRCISTCVPAVAEQLTALPQADCAPDERCAPCYNPIDGSDTGACTNGCDTGPTEPAKTFAPCGNDGSDGTPLGLCVPVSSISPELQANLPPATCPAGYLCAPRDKVIDPTYRFAACTASGALFQPGACVPEYIVLADPQGVLLAQDTCPTGYRCAPCVNPLTQMTTHACD